MASSPLICQPITKTYLTKRWWKESCLIICHLASQVVVINMAKNHFCSADCSNNLFEIECKSEWKSWKGRDFPWAGRATPWSSPASPWKTPSVPSSFTRTKPITTHLHDFLFCKCPYIWKGMIWSFFLVCPRPSWNFMAW